MTPVPKIVHQTWKTKDVPTAWQPYQQAWLRFCEEYHYEYKLWTDEDNRNLIQTDFPWFLEKFDSYPHGIQRADAVRYFIGYKYGGVYSDLDVGPIQEKFGLVDALIQEYGSKKSVAYPETLNTVLRDNLTNNFLIMQPNSPFLTCLWKSLENPSAYHWTFFKRLLRTMHKFHVLLTTGPGIVNDQALLNPDLIETIPVELINDPTSENCLMSHGPGKSWHDKKQMGKDVATFSIVTLLIISFVVFAIGLSLFYLYKSL